jgi:excisionase family DNA binding protein
MVIMGEIPCVSQMIEKTFLTTRDAADLLGVSVGTVQIWVENGLLQAWKTAGGHRRVHRESVEKLLKKQPEASLPPFNATPISASPRRLRVMVVEDDASLLRLYQTHIGRWPMAPEVIATDSAIEALLMIGRKSPDLLISDLHMPGMDGFAMLKVLSAAPEVANTTIVAVTGLDAADVQARGGIPAGIEILPKPIPFARLIAIATALVAQSGFHQVTA